MTSDFAELPIDPRTAASDLLSIENIRSGLGPAVNQIKSDFRTAFNEMPQYAFQDMPSERQIREGRQGSRSPRPPHHRSPLPGDHPGFRPPGDRSDPSQPAPTAPARRTRRSQNYQ